MGSRVASAFILSVGGVWSNLREFILIVDGVWSSLAANHSPPGQSSGRTAKPRVESEEGLANIALDCVSTDQSDLIEAIRSNFIHDSGGCKPSRSCAISPAESV